MSSPWRSHMGRPRPQLLATFSISAPPATAAPPVVVAIEPARDDDDGPGSGLLLHRDWSKLPEDLLVSVLRALHVADAIRSGAVCVS
nr:unnamed protein product [Digitaria exilis]